MTDSAGETGTDATTLELTSLDLELVSVGNRPVFGDNDPSAFFSSASDDGRYVLYTSSSPEVARNDFNGGSDVFVRDTATGETILVSKNVAGTGTASGSSRAAQISGDGRYVLFFSDADDLVANDTNGLNDVFRHDLVTGTTELVSVNMAGTAGNGSSFFETGNNTQLNFMSSDGRHIVFISSSTDLVPETPSTPTDTTRTNTFVRDMDTGTTTLVNVNLAGTAPGDHLNNFVPIQVPEISADGSRIVFQSQSSDLTADANTDNNFDIFVRDRVAGTTTLVSTSISGGASAGFAHSPRISADGNFVVYQSRTTDITANPDNNGTVDLFRYDIAAGTNELVSVTSSGSAGNRFSGFGSVSADGRYIAFKSSASDLVTNGNGRTDIYWRDMLTGETQVVSVRTDGTSTNTFSDTVPYISADGSRVAYISRATGVVTNDLNDLADVFVRDIPTATTFLASENAAGTNSGDGVSGRLVANVPSLVFPLDGDSIIFNSLASDLTNNVIVGSGLYKRDLAAGVTELVADRNLAVEAATGGGGFTNRSSFSSSSEPPPRVVSSDGRFVVFLSSGDVDSTNPGNNNFTTQVYVRDRLLDTTELVSVTSSGTPGNSSSSEPSITPDGRFVTFASFSSDLTANDTNVTGDVFVRDLQLGTTTLVTANAAGTDTANASSLEPRISDDGRYVVFRSFADDFGPTDSNGAGDIYVRDLQLGTTDLVSVNAAGTDAADSLSFDHSVSADGTVIAFTSTASDLVAGDGNGTRDVFVRDLTAGTTLLVSRNASGQSATGNSEDGIVSADGRYVGFESTAADVSPLVTDSTRNVFLFDIQAQTNELISVDVAGTGAGNSSSADIVLSADASVVAFLSSATNLDPAVTGTRSFASQVYIRDRAAGTTRLVTRDINDPTLPADRGSFNLTINTSGEDVAFVSEARNIREAGGFFRSHVYQYDVIADTLQHVSVNVLGQPGFGDSYEAYIGESTLVFTSERPLTVSNPTSRSQVYAFDLDAAPAIIAGDLDNAFMEDDLAFSGQLMISDPNGVEEEAFNVLSEVAGLRGAFSIDTNGAWTYVPNTSLQELAAGQILEEEFVVTSLDGTPASVSLLITGENDLAVITGDTTGSTDEDSASPITGALSASDVDGDGEFVVDTFFGSYGTFGIDADGNWEYAVDNAMVQDLAAGTSVSEDFTVTTSDGTTVIVSVTVSGNNDLAAIGGVASGSTDEDATEDITGTLTITDVDAGENLFQSQANVAGNYGTFSVDANGIWTFTVDNSAVQSLNDGESFTDTFNVVSFDGLSSVAIVVTINGLSDSPEEVIPEIIEEIDELIDEGTLDNGQGNPVGNFLSQALKDIDKGRIGKAINKLEDARDRIQELLDSGDLLSDEANPLLASIDAVLATLNG